MTINFRSWFQSELAAIFANLTFYCLRPPMPGLSSRQPVSGMYGIGKINIRFKPKPKRGFPCGAVLFFLAVLLFVMTFLFSQTWARYSIVLPCIRAALGTMGYLREWINTPFMFQFPELQQSVQISRDSKGINFIEASCIEDAMFAQGYVHAAEHIIRMERERRIGYGTLAEIEGVGALLSDRAARTLDLGTLSARDWDSESERARSLLESYSSGVNAYLRSSRLLPIELYLMGMTSIAPWAGADSLLLMRVHALALHSTWERTLMEDVLRLNLDKDVAEEYIQALETSARWAQGVGAIVGAAQSSNAWAKAHEDGSVTLDAQVITPAGLLHNYPIMGIRGGPSLQVSGGSIPGIPFIVHGRSKKMVWSYLDVSAEVSEHLTREDGRPGHPKQVKRLPGSDSAGFACEIAEGEEWCDVKTRVETITVYDKSTYEHTEYVHYSVNGPIVSSLLSGPKRHAAIQTTLQSDLLASRYSIDQLMNVNTAADIPSAILNQGKSGNTAFLLAQNGQIAILFSNGSAIDGISNVSIARPGADLAEETFPECPDASQSTQRLGSIFENSLGYVDVNEMLGPAKESFGDVMEIMKSPSFVDSKEMFLAVFNQQLKRILLDSINKDLPSRQFIEAASPSFLSGGIPLLDDLELRQDWVDRILSRGDESAIIRRLGGMRKFITRVISDSINVGEAAYGPVKSWNIRNSRLVYFTRRLEVAVNRLVDFAPVFTVGPFLSPGSSSASSAVQVASRGHRPTSQLGARPLDNEGNTITSFIMRINISASGAVSFRAISAPGQSSHVDSRYAYSAASQWARCGLMDLGETSRSVVASLEPLRRTGDRSAEL